ncbi:hypothetical protein TNIN_177751 [Trichonephila inaurata madagascariensis]|uniref:Uncharacterized protein n=1 Tax=Trichonephila inaurata madagascariensis TaxID=2747483 RepID=A0A8X6X785_9ARAC|nr:hypothetical protein TNIN_177751 [Trichonephila inaurata madagascariensis]
MEFLIRTPFPAGQAERNYRRLGRRWNWCALAKVLPHPSLFSSWRCRLSRYAVIIEESAVRLERISDSIHNHLYTEEEERVGARVEIERPPNMSRHSAWNRVWFPNNCSPEIDERSGIESRNAREPTVTLWGERARQLFKTKYFRVQKKEREKRGQADLYMEYQRLTRTVLSEK